MDVFRLTIQASPARLDMQAQNLRLDTRMPAASMEITKEKGSVSVQAEHPRLSVDATEAKSEEGHETVAQLVSDFAQRGKQAVDEAARQYNEMGRVYRSMARNKNAIARHALEQAVPAMPTYGLRFVPSAPPQISFTDNVFSYSIQPDQTHIQWTIHQSASISEDRPAQISIWMAQQPELHFSAQA
ncbi:DUF6470 family protein [Ethanoligenens harbinense]|uniref:Uncharacterized protein n=1 Tax=Ethanoligenens harbinense (strain DSM 18485 / JCM 12961 / CGMCC 1.5033 / YUAN-3) TaxID=663278 RepID=E6U6H4_ETHHY|nr:DUF6470 family protein [Ethanoligenens harbinense]ADU28044.1 hypothetical protein Ethha_2551 [Ethanoligenens harbinense YUAN-3]AVQ97061.1 hypothetical protein CXQ68_13105 [Ethanoligenens harbinense YUAN-3]AYF39723.1 hypothetical protein CXP51_13005 [Ethanoligenens harbinense]AYF42556.1 hypothetical protein CN246_13585 [Ethanoligenens harbinense]QCN93304.1 hypothetical protein DRA42_13155 [Ethanoligenens harbinense]